MQGRGNRKKYSKILEILKLVELLVIFYFLPYRLP